jgi:hypothetical protein
MTPSLVRRNWKLLLAVIALPLLLASAALGLAVSAHLDLAPWRYPGAQSVAGSETVITPLAANAFGREDVYLANTGFVKVLKWYQDRLEADPDRDLVIVPFGDCVWLLDTRQLLWVSRTLGVLLCAVPNGTTRISVNDLVRFGH